MQVLLRYERTGHYYRGEDEWAMSANDARDFKRVERALQVVADDHLEQMSLIWLYGPGQMQEFSLDAEDRAELLRRSVLRGQPGGPG